jgi:hypothetical protein
MAGSTMPRRRSMSIESKARLTSTLTMYSCIQQNGTYNHIRRICKRRVQPFQINPV